MADCRRVNVISSNNTVRVHWNPLNLTYDLGIEPGASGLVTSVFGRTGDVIAMAGDYDVTLITGAAPIDNPVFTGVPQAPTASFGDCSSQIATTAFVCDALSTITTTINWGDILGDITDQTDLETYIETFLNDYTADNGITLLSNNFKLGGVFTNDTVLGALTDNFGLTIRRIGTGNLSTFSTETVDGIAALFTSAPASTNTLVNVATYRRHTTGTPAVGMGGYNQYTLETSGVGGTDRAAMELSWEWTNSTEGAQAADVSFRLANGSGAALAANLPVIILHGGTGGITTPNYGDGLYDGALTYVAGWDSNGNLIERDPADFATDNDVTITADNGLRKDTPTNVRIGGTGLENTTIAWGNFTFTNSFNSITSAGAIISSNSTAVNTNETELVSVDFSGANAASTLTTRAVSGSNTRTGTSATNIGVYGFASGGSVNTGVMGQSSAGNAVYGLATTGIGAYGQAASSGIGVQGSSSSGTALKGFTGTGVALDAAVTASTVVDAPVLIASFVSQANGSATTGYGGYLSFLSEASSAGTNREAAQLGWRWTTITDASRVSDLFFKVVNNAVSTERFKLAGSGQLTLSAYGDNLFTGTATKLAGFDADGNIIEVDPSSSAAVLRFGVTGEDVSASANRAFDLGANGFSYTANKSTGTGCITLVNSGSTSAINVSVVGGSPAIQGSATGLGSGINATSTAGYGAILTTTTGTALLLNTNNATDNGLQTALEIRRTTTGIPATGLGSTIVTQLETTVGLTTASTIDTVWTNATGGAESSKMVVKLAETAVVAAKLTLEGSGAFRLHTYGDGTFTGTLTRLAGFDAAGNVIEVDPASVGGGTDRFGVFEEDDTAEEDRVFNLDGTEILQIRHIQNWENRLSIEAGRAEITSIGSGTGAITTSAFVNTSFSSGNEDFPQVNAIASDSTTSGGLKAFKHAGQLFGNSGSISNVVEANSDQVDIYAQDNSDFSFETLALYVRMLPVHADEAAAVTAGLATDRVYKTATGELRIKL